VGQQPGIGPTLDGQKAHPAAQVFWPWDGTAVTGTTIVLPSEMMVVMDGGGQLVVAQSRPVWQQPPPAEARQA
jgi:hypothetical protein